MQRYVLKNPWVKKYYSSKGRSGKRKNGRIHTMKVKDFKELWFRDKAWLLKSPSIDRIDPSQGYIKENCRFIERSENSRLGNLGRKHIPKTQCKYGHPLNEKTTYSWKGDSKRKCKKCRNFMSNRRRKIRNLLDISIISREIISSVK